MDFITLDEFETYVTPNMFLNILEIKMLMNGHRVCFPKIYNGFRNDLFYMRFMLNEQHEIVGFVTFAIWFTNTGPNIIILQRETLFNHNISMKEVNNEVENMISEFGIPITVLPNPGLSGDTDGFSTNVTIIDI